jgi:ribosomal protein S1
MRKNSTKSGSNTSVKVHAIVSNGITVEVFGNTYFLPYNSNPWFEKAKVSDVFNVEMLGNEGIRWEALDVDLAIDSLTHPEKYPLIAKYI